MHTTYTDGVAFIEGRPGQTTRTLGRVEVKIGGMFHSSQLKNLNDVKRLLAQEVKRQGGNALIDFTYGQRSVGWFASIFSRDDVSWYGAGVAAIIPSTSFG